MGWYVLRKPNLHPMLQAKTPLDKNKKIFFLIRLTTPHFFGHIMLQETKQIFWGLSTFYCLYKHHVFPLQAFVLLGFFRSDLKLFCVLNIVLTFWPKMIYISKTGVYVWFYFVVWFLDGIRLNIKVCTYIVCRCS